MAWTNRLMNLFRRGRLDAEIEEELRFHTEVRVRDHLAAYVGGGTAARCRAPLRRPVAGARSHAFGDMAAYRESDGPLMEASGAATEAEWTGYAWVTGNFFALLGRYPVLGRVFGNEEFANSSRVVVLSYRLWQQRFHGSA